jgi:lysophospholipase L1-like esterase
MGKYLVQGESSLKQKLLVIVFGLFIAVLIGEGLFRLGGLLLNQTKSNDIRRKATYRIICIGDSTTYGIGASNIKKYSYPSQLQEILDSNTVNKKIDVINLGSPGINSSQVLNRFEKNINDYKPDIVIMMIGINDPWNFEESNVLKFYNISPVEALYERIKLMLNQFKLYQFLKLVHLSDKFKELKIPAFDIKSQNKAVEFFKDNLDRVKAFNMAIVNNIANLKQISDDNNVKIIFMKYHNVGWGRPELIIHSAYMQLKVPVVDNERLFIKAQQIGLNVWGNDKWHPNDLGYSFIAKNIFNKLVALKLVASDPIDIF